MKLPDLSSLQFVVLGALLQGERSGQEIRDELAKQKLEKSGPAFYQAMSRLEDAKFVKGRYEEKMIGGQRIKERRYELTGSGERAWNQTRDFYMTIAVKATGGLVHA